MKFLINIFFKTKYLKSINGKKDLKNNNIKSLKSHKYDFYFEFIFIHINSVAMRYSLTFQSIKMLLLLIIMVL